MLPTWIIANAMKQKTKSDAPSFTHRIPAKTTIDFISTLSVDDCRQRVSGLAGTHLSYNRIVDVVIIDNHFTISVLSRVVPSTTDAGYPRVARCIGDLNPLPDGTHIVAKAENFITIGFERTLILWMWVLWGIFMLVIVPTSGDGLITDDTLVWGIITGWMPVVFHLGAHWDFRTRRRQSVDFSRWLYTLLFEYTTSDADTESAAPNIDLRQSPDREHREIN